MYSCPNDIPRIRILHYKQDHNQFWECSSCLAGQYCSLKTQFVFHTCYFMRGHFKLADDSHLSIKYRAVPTLLQRPDPFFSSVTLTVSMQTEELETHYSTLQRTYKCTCVHGVGVTRLVAYSDGNFAISAKGQLRDSLNCFKCRKQCLCIPYSLDITPPSIISPPYYLHKFATNNEWQSCMQVIL